MLNVQTQSVNVAGVGVTNVRRVFTNIVGYSSDAVFDNTLLKLIPLFTQWIELTMRSLVVVSEQAFNFGEYSWGKINSIVDQT